MKLNIFSRFVAGLLAVLVNQLVASAAHTISGISGGCNGSCNTRFFRDGQLIGQGWRGFNVAVFDPITLSMEAGPWNFDTWANKSAQSDLVRTLFSIPTGKIIMVLVGDEAGFIGPMSVQPVADALEYFGARQIRSYAFRGSYALIAQSGAVDALSESYVNTGDAPVSFSVPVAPNFVPGPRVKIRESQEGPVLFAISPQHSVVSLHYSEDLSNWINLTNTVATSAEVSFPGQLPRLTTSRQVFFRTAAKWSENGIRAISRGCNAGCLAEVWRGNDMLYARGGGGGGGRGFNIGAFDLNTGQSVRSLSNFDTYADGGQFGSAVEFIRTAPDGSLVVIAGCDEMGMSNPASATIRSFLHQEFGAQLIGAVGFRYSYVFMGIRGHTPLVEAVSANQPVEGVVRFPQ